MKAALLKEKLIEISEALNAGDAGCEIEPCEYLDSLTSLKSDMEVDELVDHIRLQSKYLLFALEAAHRERSFLLKMLEKSQG